VPVGEVTVTAVPAPSPAPQAAAASQAAAAPQVPPAPAEPVSSFAPPQPPVTAQASAVEQPYRPRSFEPEPQAFSPRSFEPEPPEPSSRRGTASYGESVLPLRATTGDGDPLDPGYTAPDTVEARSEWMASAVLYEEMSTLLRRGVFQEETVTPTNDEQTYRPTMVAEAEAGGGLVRRSRGDGSAAPADRFTARIERDPEQLRARLSAFQTATARGRSAAASAETPSTDAGPTVNDVPGSAPQQR
jgi:hypothetical protein